MIDWTCAFSFLLLCHIVIGVSKSAECSETDHTNKTEHIYFPSLHDLYGEVFFIWDTLIVVNCSLLLVDQRIISLRAMGEILETLRPLIGVVLSRLRQEGMLDFCRRRFLMNSECLIQTWVNLRNFEVIVIFVVLRTLRLTKEPILNKSSANRPIES